METIDAEIDVEALLSAARSPKSSTVTLKNPAFFAMMNDFSGNETGTGGLVTFKDSNWLMSIVLAHHSAVRDHTGSPWFLGH